MYLLLHGLQSTLFSNTNMSSTALDGSKIQTIPGAQANIKDLWRKYFVFIEPCVFNTKGLNILIAECFRKGKKDKITARVLNFLRENSYMKFSK